MRSLDQWFQEYGESHQHPTNKLVHWFCVPLITFCVIGLFWAANVWFAWAFVTGALVFYLRLSVRLALGMAVVVSCMLLGILWLQALGHSVLVISTLSLFVVAWVIQFWGHHIEGKKPSFFKDIQFLLIGPLWVLAFLFRKVGMDY